MTTTTMTRISPAIRPVGMHELVLEVTDLAASERFYHDVLGLPIVQRWGSDRPAVWLDAGDTVAIGLWPHESSLGAIAGGRGGAHVHFALRLPHGSVSTVEARLQALGYHTERVDFDDGNRSVYVDDPDGNCVELMDAVVDWAQDPIDAAWL